MPDELRLGAVYERSIAASLERLWENVHDWEHLPWVHEGAFSGIELEESGDWGWRARVGLAGGDETLRVELRREPDREVYHTRTLEGPGEGSDTIVRLIPRSERVTDIRVEFWLAVPDEQQAEMFGKGLLTLYARLWDEDEAMMVMRQEVIDGVRSSPARAGTAAPAPLALGPWSELSARLPLAVSTAQGEFRVVETDSGFFAHSVFCPHRGGPLGEGEIEAGHVVCPWHGYRFVLASGRGADGRRCHMAKPPRVELGADGQALLFFADDRIAEA
ncbi:MAG: Rieske 2Fe-2S domain-containing protein [Myxococcota bacterium]|nr:Rieske 2Fe-2S domain-containing protein [Myxococcota bacterium]